MLNFFLDLLFPEKCLGCKKSGVPVCVDCILAAEPAVDPNDLNVFSPFAFHDPVIRKSIQKLKYYGGKQIADSLGAALYDRALETISDKRQLWGLSHEEQVVLIPIPLSASRLNQRGYNQTELIVNAFVKEARGMSFTVFNNVLYKTRETKSQVSVKDRNKRLRNILGAFEVKNKVPIVDRCVILFDDVTTTGATLAECRKVLIASGAREVFAITVAH